MEKLTVIRAAGLLARVAVSAVFLFAGAVKIADPAAFLSDVGNYRLVPASVALAVASYLPWLELAAAIALWIPRVRRGATLILLGLTVGFVLAIVSAWVRGIDLDCGCFGSSDASSPVSHLGLILRDVLILAALVVVSLADRRPSNTLI